jgi:hypothetical protein
LLVWLFLLLAGTVAAQTSTPGYLAPDTITTGGTYKGRFESLNSNVPVIVIETDQPVIIEDCILRGSGILIKSYHPNANVTVRNTSGYGLTPTIDQTRPGRFLDANNFANIRVEHCYMQQTSGIYLAAYQGNYTEAQTIKILYNKAKNIDGRFRDGGFERVQFTQLNGVRAVPHVEIAWNQVINIPDSSRVEDNINIFQSSGTAASSIEVHHNYIQGAYPVNPTVPDDYTGGGILLGEAPGRVDGNGPVIPDKTSAYTKAYNNQVIGTIHYGIGFTGGRHIQAVNNRVICSSVLDNGDYLPNANVGIYAVNESEQNGAVQTDYWNNNIITGNYVAYVKRYPNNDNRNTNNFYIPGMPDPESVFRANTEVFHTETPITRDTERAEWTRWQDTLRAAM